MNKKHYTYYIKDVDKEEKHHCYGCNKTVYGNSNVELIEDTTYCHNCYHKLKGGVKNG